MRQLRLVELDGRDLPNVSVTSYDLALGQATFTGDHTSNTLEFSDVGGVLGFETNGGGVVTDLDPVTPGNQELALGSGTAPLITVNFGAANDQLVLVEPWAYLTPITVGGNTGDDSLTLAGSVLVKVAGSQSGVFGPTGNSFASMENLVGGTGDDTVQMVVGGVIKSLNGGAGSNTLDYSLYSSEVRVHLGAGMATNTLGVSGFVSVVGGSGDDYLVGNGGNNTFIGNAGHDIVVGGAGDDTVAGGPGNDVLIGGLGSDSLAGDGGDDLLIGGTTSHDGNISALFSIRLEWKQGTSASVRRSHLRGTLPGGFNGATYLKSTTVFDDLSVDSLSDSTGSDWFWVFAGDSFSGDDFLN